MASALREGRLGPSKEDECEDCGEKYGKDFFHFSPSERWIGDGLRGCEFCIGHELADSRITKGCYTYIVLDAWVGCGVSPATASLGLEQGERESIGLAVGIFFEGGSEELMVGGIGGGCFEEKRHGGAELEIVGRAENSVEGCVFDLVHEARTLAEARAEDGMLKIGAGFFERGDGEMARGGAEAEALNLWEDEPHPVGSFAAGGEFADDVVVNVGLRVEKTLQVVGIGHDGRSRMCVEILAGGRRSGEVWTR